MGECHARPPKSDYEQITTNVTDRNSRMMTRRASCNRSIAPIIPNKRR